MTTTTTNPEATTPPAGTEDFVSVLSLTPAPDVARAALDSLDGISAWWGPASGSAAAGGHLSVDFDEGRIVDVVVGSVEARRVEWTVTGAPHTPEWVGTTISFELVPSGAGTQLRFRHAGLTPRLDCYDFCFAGWAHFLASLMAYVNTGQGHPHGAA
jgi:hypothetical protein